MSLQAGNEISLAAGSEIEAEGGSITLNAPAVIEDATLDADSIGDANGVVEIDASQSLTLGANSDITATGDPATTSPGGFVVLKAGNSFADTSGSTISVSGNDGGQAGVVELFDPGVGVNPIQTKIEGAYFAYLVNPHDMTLSDDSTAVSTTPSSDPDFYVDDLAAYSQVDLQALDDIDFQSSLDGISAVLSLNSTVPNASLSLNAGHNINFPVDFLGDASGIGAGNNCSIALTAGNGIYLWGNSTIQSAGGDITLWAGNEVQVGWNGSEQIGQANAGAGSVTTTAGGNISVTAESGDVNTGSSVFGFDYSPAAPYLSASTSLGGISTADGGNVTINAGGDVTSLAATTVALDPTQSSPVDTDAGSGAFGSEPGNVTINAGGNVYGHFVVADGTGTINAGQDIGTSDDNVALSLVSGSWILNAQQDIYLQEVRNPNGLYNTTTTGFGFNKKASAGNHRFDYSQDASVTLSAGDGVYLTGDEVPRPDGAIPVILPPTLIIDAGQGGVTLDAPTATSDGNPNDVSLQGDDNTVLFPSPDGNLEITTTDGGDFDGGTGAYLLMSDSGLTQWFNTASGGYSGPVPFGPQDHASVPFENDNPVILNISGSMNDVILQVPKLADITVDQDMNNCSFYGVNLNAWDVTSITVGGQIFDATALTSITLDQAFPDLLQLQESLLSAGDSFLPPGTQDNWYEILQLAVSQSAVNSQTSLLGVPFKSLAGYLSLDALFPSLNLGPNVLEYDPSTRTLTVAGPLAVSADTLSDTLYSVLTSGTLYLPVYAPNGYPVVDTTATLADGQPNPNYGHFEIAPVTWLQPNTTTYTDPDLADLQTLLTESQGKPPLVSSGALIVGGTGQFDITADSINLGISDGILSVGNGGTPANPFLGDVSYSYLTPYITSGATINVTVTGADLGPTVSSLEMPSSAIAALGGGDVNVSTPNGSMDLGSEALADFDAQIMAASDLGEGIYTTGGGNINLLALGAINIDSSRVATLNGGNIVITSLTGDVDAGSGGTTPIPINVFPLTTTLPTPYEYAYANGIVADTLQPEPATEAYPNGVPVPGSASIPGNITVNTPEGDIVADIGGILQESLGGALPPGPTVNLTAGTPANDDWSSTASPEYVGNVDLGNAGVIGGTVNVRATGKVSGLLISQQNANVTSQTIGSLTVFAVGTANVSGAGSGPGITIIGGQGVTASGITGATLLGQNVSVNGGSAQNTLGTSANASASSQSAAQQSTQSATAQVADTGAGDQDNKKKKKGPEIRKVGRVTVILAATVPKR